MGGIYILIPSIVVCCAIGAIVLARSIWDRMTVTYGALTLTLVAMSIANQLAIDRQDNQLFYVRLVMAFSTIAVGLAYALVLQLRGGKVGRSYMLLVSSLTVVVAAFDFSPLLFAGVFPGNPPVPILGPAVSLYFFHFLSVFSLTIMSLYDMRRSAANKKKRQQYQLLITGTLPIFLLAPLTSFILPNVFGLSWLVVLTPLYALLFASCVGYAIVRHGLFDVRLAVVRTVAYGLSIATMALVYFGLAYVASITIFNGRMTTGVSMGPANIALALVLAFIFQPIKQFFDHWTDAIFYRDRYDKDEFIARLSRVLTSTTHLREVLDRALVEVVTTLKASGGAFLIYGDSRTDIVVGDKKLCSYGAEDAKLIRRIVEVCGRGVLLVHGERRDSSNAEQRRIMKLLEKRRVALVLPLVSASRTVGYLFLGEQMVNGYAKRDAAVLETVADELVIAIQNAHSAQEVREMNKSLERRIENATKELRETNAKLIEMDAVKDEFVSLASHQLRTPLTSIKGYISMVLEGDAGKITPAQRQLLDEAFMSSERMVHLIGDFLNVSRLQTGRFMIDYQMADMSKVVAQEVESIRTVAAAHGMTVTYKSDKLVPMLYVDEGKLRQVIMNFIDNAIYYSPDSQHITVTLTVEDGEVVLRVIDEGMGVPKEMQKQLFTKFYRAENARKQRPDGTGIGLYLAKKIIDAHGGSIVFESEQDKGSTFGFRLPIRKLSVRPVVVDEARLETAKSR